MPRPYSFSIQKTVCPSRIRKMAISAFPQKDRIPCKFMIWVHTPQFLFFPQTFETYFKQLQWPPERFSISNPLILKHYMKYCINCFPDWKQTFRNCDGSCRTRTLRKRQSSRGTTCWESLNRPFSNIPFSGRAALPEHGLDIRANCRPAFGHVLHYLDNFFICLERLKSKELN